MARLMTFKSLVQESIANSDAKEFQALVTKKLNESMVKHKKTMLQTIKEELDANFSKAVEIGNASKSYGARKFVYEAGVLTITVPNHQAVEHFADYLEECDEVDSYEVHALVESNPEGSPVDLEVAKFEPDTNFEFTIYLGPGAPSISESRVVFLEEKDCDEDDEDDNDEDEDDDEDDDDEDDEKDSKKKEESDD